MSMELDSIENSFVTEKTELSQPDPCEQAIAFFLEEMRLYKHAELCLEAQRKMEENRQHQQDQANRSSVASTNSSRPGTYIGTATTTKSIKSRGMVTMAALRSTPGKKKQRDKDETKNSIKWRIERDWGIDLDSYVETDLEIDKTNDDDISLQELYSRACKKYRVSPIRHVNKSINKCESVRVSNMGLSDKNIKPLCITLSQSDDVTHLDMNSNRIEKSGLRWVMQLLSINRNIVELNISGNPLGSQGASLLAEDTAKLTNLTSLKLANCNFKEVDAENISLIIANCGSLESLDISNNNFSGNSGIFIANGIKENYKLLRLNLSWCNIRENGAVAIAMAIKENGTLERVDLSWNGFSDKGATFLGMALASHTSLLILNLSANRIGAFGAIEFAKALATNDMLEELFFNQNPITSRGAQQLITELSKNPNTKLKYLNIASASLPYESVAKLSEMESAPKLLCNSLIHDHDKKTSELFEGKLGEEQGGSPLAVVGVYTRQHRLQMSTLVRNFLQAHDTKESEPQNKSEISPSDLKNILKRLHVPLEEEKIDKMVDNLILNDNQKIEVESIESLLASSDKVDFKLISG